MSKIRYADYEDDEMMDDEMIHFKTYKKNHNQEYSKEYNGRKSKSKNKFKKMRDIKNKKFEEN